MFGRKRLDGVPYAFMSPHVAISSHVHSAWFGAVFVVPVPAPILGPKAVREFMVEDP